MGSRRTGRIFAGSFVATVLVVAVVQGVRRGEETPPTPKQGVASGAAGKPAAAAGTATGSDVAAAVRPAVDGSGRRIPIIDVHVHLRPDALPRLHHLMDRYGFDHAVNLSGGHPRRDLAASLAAEAQSGRLTTFAALAYEQAQLPDFGPRMAELLQQAHARGARGLKIAKLLGLGLTDPDGRLIAVDDPRLDVVFDTAGQLGMPVAIHAGDPRAFWLPVDRRNERFAELSAHPGWSQHGRDVPSFDAILDQLDRRVARHPGTTFISVHFGNCAEDLGRVARTLQRFDNLYIDTAARIPELGRHPVEQLRAFFIEFQDRILYGSDLGVGPEPAPLFLGSAGSEPPTDADRERFFDASRRFFETRDRNFAHPTAIQGDWRINGIGLPTAVLEKVYWRNAARLLGISL